MKKRILAAILMTAVLMAFGMQVRAEGTQTVTPIEGTKLMRCTCYLDQGTCADGIHEARQGICAMAKEYIGKTAVIYMVNADGSVGSRIAILEICDTGYGAYDEETGLGTIQAGKTIDIWMPSEEAVANWIGTYGDYVYVEIKEGVKG